MPFNPAAAAAAINVTNTLSPAEIALRSLLVREHPGIATHPDFGGIVVDPGPIAPPAAAPTAPTAPVRPPIEFTRVQPGDLISAGYINGLIDIMHLLDLRLIALETAESASTRPNG